MIFTVFGNIPSNVAQVGHTVKTKSKISLTVWLDFGNITGNVPNTVKLHNENFFWVKTTINKCLIFFLNINHTGMELACLMCPQAELQVVASNPNWQWAQCVAWSNLWYIYGIILFEKIMSGIGIWIFKEYVDLFIHVLRLTTKFSTDKFPKSTI